MSRGKSRGEERRDSRAWLGPPGQGGERLARVFGVGSSSERDVERTLDDLRTNLTRLEEEVNELTSIVRSTVSGSSSAAHGHPPVIELPRVPQASDRDYWLSRCDHFTVYAGERIVGVVEGMRFRSRVDRPDVLEIRCGHLDRRLVLIPVDDIDLVEPEEKRIVLQDARPIPGVRGFLRLRLDRFRTPPRELPH